MASLGANAFKQTLEEVNFIGCAIQTSRILNFPTQTFFSKSIVSSVQRAATRAGDHRLELPLNYQTTTPAYTVTFLKAFTLNWGGKKLYSELIWHMIYKVDFCKLQIPAFTFAS